MSSQQQLKQKVGLLFYQHIKYGLSHPLQLKKQITWKQKYLIEQFLNLKQKKETS